MLSSCTAYNKTRLRIIIINICQAPVISHNHACVLLSVMLILIIDYHFCIQDSFGVEMEKLSALTEGDPVSSAQGVNLVTNIFNGKFTVCIEGGFCLNTTD